MRPALERLRAARVSQITGGRDRFATSGCSLSPHLGLEGPVDGTEGPRADPLQEPVAAQGLAGDIEGGVLAEDLLLEATQLGGGVDPQLLCQESSGPLIGGQGVGLPTRAIQGRHEVCPQPFPQGVGSDQGLELRDEIGVSS